MTTDADTMRKDLDRHIARRRRIMTTPTTEVGFPWGAPVTMTETEFQQFDERWRNAESTEERYALFLELTNSTTPATDTTPDSDKKDLANAITKALGFTEPDDDTTMPDTWNADTSPFDPVRAGMLRVSNNPAGWGKRCAELSFNVHRVGVTWEIEIEYGGMINPAFDLPADLPHATVMAILRANGYEGGDDESV